MKSLIVTITAAVSAVAFAIWGGFIFCLQTTIEGAKLYTLIPIYMLLVLLGVFFEQVVHEGAHFLVGSICKMGVQVPKIRLFKSSSVDVFPIGVKGMRARFVVTAMAGPFFDLLLVVLGIIAFLAPSVPAVLGILSPYALYSLIINGFPIQYGAGKTDALVSWEVITNQPTAQVMLNILRIQGHMRSGVQLADIDQGLLLDVPQLPEDDINFIILTQLRYEYYLAKGDDSTAYKYFARYQQLIHYLPSEYRQK